MDRVEILKKVKKLAIQGHYIEMFPLCTGSQKALPPHADEVSSTCAGIGVESSGSENNR